MNKLMFRYLVFNRTLNYAHELITDKFYGWRAGKKISIWDEEEKMSYDCILICYEDTVYNKSKEQLAREKAEKEALANAVTQATTNNIIPMERRTA